MPGSPGVVGETPVLSGREMSLLGCFLLLYWGLENLSLGHLLLLGGGLILICIISRVYSCKQGRTEKVKSVASCPNWKSEVFLVAHRP